MSLIQNALIGTERQHLDKQILPKAVQLILEQKAEEDPEIAFLNAVSLDFVYQKAGQGPQKIEAIKPVGIAAETKSYVPKAQLNIWKQIREGKYVSTVLEARFLEIMVERSWLMPSNMLVEMLHFAAQPKHKHLLSSIVPVLGNRGLWLAQQKEDWAWINEQHRVVVDEAHWLDGRASVRIQILEKMRSQDADLGRFWLEKSWNAEHARDRIVLLKALKTGLSRADLPFLERIYAELQAGDLSKKLTAEALSIVSSYLLLFEESQHFQKIKTVLLSYVDFKKSKIDIPKNFDDFWSMPSFLSLFGLQFVPDQTQQPEDLFGVLLQTMPPSFWKKIFETSADSVVDFFKKKDPKILNDSYFDLLLVAVLRHKDADFSGYYCTKIKKKEQQIYLINCLTDQEKEAVFMKDVSLFHLIYQVEYILAFSWSKEFSTFIVKELYASFSKYYFQLESAFQNYWPYIHKDTKLDFSKPKVPLTEHAEERWKSKIQPEIQQVLDLKRQIESMHSV